MIRYKLKGDGKSLAATLVDKSKRMTSINQEDSLDDENNKTSQEVYIHDSKPSKFTNENSYKRASKRFQGNKLGADSMSSGSVPSVLAEQHNQHSSL